MGVFLDHLLEPLQDLLKTKDLEELSAVRPGEVFLKLAGQKVDICIQRPDLTYKYWETLFYALSNNAGVVFHPLTQPRVSTRLPDGRRFEGMTEHSVEKNLMQVAIRLQRDAEVTLDDYGIPQFLQAKLIAATAEGQSIIVSGGTSSGKTTFLNRLIQYIPLHKKVLTVEDTSELRVPHQKRYCYIVSRNEENPLFGYQQVIDSMMRNTPDIIIAGELSVVNTFPTLRLLQTGHRGFMTSVHSDDCRTALEETIPMNVKLSGQPYQGVDDFLKKKVDWVIQINKVEQDDTIKRQVTEVWQPVLNDHWQWSGELLNNA